MNKSSNFLLGEQLGRELMGEVDQAQPLTENDDVKFSEAEKKLAADLLNEAIERGASPRDLFGLGVSFGRTGRRLLTEQADDDEVIPLLLEQKGEREGSFSARRRAVSDAIKKRAGSSAKVVALFSDSVIFESEQKHFKAGYTYHCGSAQLAEASELKGTLHQITEQSNKEWKSTLWNLRVAGYGKTGKPASSKPIDEATLTERERKDLKIAGLM